MAVSNELKKQHNRDLIYYVGYEELLADELVTKLEQCDYRVRRFVALDDLDSCQAVFRRCKAEVRPQFSLTEIRQAASARIAAIQTAAKTILEGRQSAAVSIGRCNT